MASFRYFSCLWCKSIASSSREKYGFYRLTSELILELITRQLSHYAPLSHFAPRYSKKDLCKQTSQKLSQSSQNIYKYQKRLLEKYSCNTSFSCERER